MGGIIGLLKSTNFGMTQENSCQKALVKSRCRRIRITPRAVINHLTHIRKRTFEILSKINARLTTPKTCFL